MSPRSLFYLLLGGATALRMGFVGIPGPAFEEAYYWNYSQHPALSYFDHPPMVAWLIGLSTAVGGDAPFWLRLPAVLLFAGATGLVYATGRDLFDERTGLAAAVLLNGLPALSLWGMTITPDTALLFSWCLGLWAGARLVQSEDPRWWWLVGLACGLGCLSKYPAALLPAGPLLFCALTWRWRLIFNPHAAGAAVLAGLLFTPVLVWNASHDWASFAFQGTGRFHEKAGVAERLASWLWQLILLTPFGFAALLAALAYGLRRRGEAHLYLLCWSLPFLGLMALLSLQRMVQMNWPMPGYLGAVVLMAALYTSGELRRPRLWAWLVVAPAAALTALPWFASLVPLGALNPADTLNGFGPAVERALEIRRAMPRPERTFLIGHGYEMASQVAYWSREPHRVLANNAFGEAAKGYDYWEDPGEFRGWDAVILEWPAKSRLSPERLEAAFQRVEGPELFTVRRGGKVLREYRLYRGYGYRGP